MAGSSMLDQKLSTYCLSIQWLEVDKSMSLLLRSSIRGAQ